MLSKADHWHGAILVSTTIEQPYLTRPPSSGVASNPHFRFKAFSVPSISHWSDPLKSGHILGACAVDCHLSPEGAVILSVTSPMTISKEWLHMVL